MCNCMYGLYGAYPYQYYNYPQPSPAIYPSYGYPAPTYAPPVAPPISPAYYAYASPAALPAPPPVPLAVGMPRGEHKVGNCLMICQ